MHGHESAHPTGLITPDYRAARCTKPPTRPGRICVVMNPAAVANLERLRRDVESRCLEREWSPMWVETTAKDPGYAMARRAVSEDADLVLCCGGDGTVMAVASVLAGTSVPMALVPCGTGDLLARNMGVPLDTEGALDAAFDGRECRFDLGRVGDRHFAVMAGLGFDGQMMCDATSSLKRRWGWFAYLIAGVPHLLDRPISVQVSLDGCLLPRQRARAVLVGNVGQLQGGVTLLPDANPFDGHLDVAVISPTGLAGWGRVAARVLLDVHRRDTRQLQRFRAPRVDIDVEPPQLFELDGEPVGSVASVSIEARPTALTLKVPA